MKPNPKTKYIGWILRWKYNIIYSKATWTILNRLLPQNDLKMIVNVD